MPSGIPLQSLATGVEWQELTGTLAGAIGLAGGRSTYVYERGTNTPVQVYSNQALTITETQPLTTASNGDIPGFIAAEQAIDFYDVLSELRAQAEPLSVADLIGTDGKIGGPGSIGLTEITTLEGLPAADYAQLAGPVFTGTAQAPTQAASDDSTKLATTAMVQAAIAAALAAEPAGAYWGATIGTQFTTVAPPFDTPPMSAVADFTAADSGGKGISILSFGENWYSTSYYGGPGTFPATQMGYVRSYGAIPMLSWCSNNVDVGGGSSLASGYSSIQIAGGSQDSYIETWASAAAAWGHPFFLRFDWEMNGTWFPWAAGFSGNGDAANFVAMWQHVHEIFQSEGATNVSWVWCPNIDESGLVSIPSLYPGNSYVDWMGMDAYNLNTSNSNGIWDQFATLIGPTYTIEQGLSAKPIMIGETGSTETGGSKASWITNMLASLPSEFPQIGGLCYLDEPYEGDNEIESSTAAQAAFAAGIASSYYRAANYGSIATSPIPR